MKQQSRMDTILGVLSELRAVAIFGSGLLVACAIVVAKPVLAWIGFTGFAVVFGLGFAARRMRASTATMRRDDTTTVPATTEAAQQPSTDVQRPRTAQEQAEEEWARQREYIRREAERVERGWQEDRARRDARRAKELAPAPKAPPAQPSAQAAESRETLQTRITENTPALWELNPDSIEYRRRERALARDQQLLVEGQQLARPAPTDARQTTPVRGESKAHGSRLSLAVGDVVMHERFRRGVVVHVEHDGYATIRFDGSGEKKLATYAPYDRALRVITNQPTTGEPAKPVAGRRGPFPNRERLYGNWYDGWALDFHTISSTLREDGSFDTTYTNLGEALNRLKYRRESNYAEFLAQELAAFMRDQWPTVKFGAIIPIPPSDLSRQVQPVTAIARLLGKRTGIVVPENYLVKSKATPRLKNIESLDERRRVLTDAFRVRDRSLGGQHVLLFDDLYRSGVTLEAAVAALSAQGGLTRQCVHVLTVTKTRSKR